ncbi:calcium/sodium antiporter [Clostridium perfringens]|uniref:calcium/sodium antiporter n=1 Tax=Clostridium perfringens TaxID=1502 RepID=UPI000E19BC37|nr:calcium/sodium antiporter [Clostridium perfringens]UBK76620.1 calcium/sodium antiporter [Clostridium perfringens]SUY31030.1 calcium/proton exchanger [Clostridium perfringens]HAT4139609.1 calcium/sodium antiporter [Clostridium perfringens]
MNYIFLIIGFLLLIKGADLFVDGASKIAKKLGVPAVIIGLTIVSLGTSAPELAVSISAALKGSNDITMGNVLGSNLFNLLAALGCTAIVAPLVIKKYIIKNDFIVNLLSTFVLYVFTFTELIGSKNSLSRIDGLVLVLMCITYIIYLIYTVKRSHKKEDEVALTSEFEDFEEQSIKSPNSTVKNIILSIVGVIGIILGGKIVVDSATVIALGLGLSEKLVGLTIVAIGTSLPELVTSLVAAKKGENDIALGNILGSNTFNILLILGLSSLISPITIAASLSIDLIFLIIVTLIIGALIFLNKKKEKVLTRYEGVFLLVLYVGYTVYIIMRN